MVTFDRPERRNAFDRSIRRGLHARMQQHATDDGLRCVVLRGGVNYFATTSGFHQRFWVPV
jgi:enoyl-CoA hydratase/carnithine racemase